VDVGVGSGHAVEEVWRAERAANVGSLTRRFGYLGLAEDAVQEAFLAASVRWPTDGMPDRPGAWLMTTAYRKAVGMLRKRRPAVPFETALDTVPEKSGSPQTWEEEPSIDDVFGLLLLCCHPALDRDARVALTLRHVCGLTVDEIAAAHVVAEPAMAKRLVRARRKIRDAKISFGPIDDLAARLDDVRTIVYLVFTEGYLASGDGPAIRGELCDEAIWLARELDRLRPDDSETLGLLALMLLNDARRSARIDATGSLVPLLEQARSSWNLEEISEARALLARTGTTMPGPYQVQAAIALSHMNGPEPDWARIADLYGVLSRIDPSPIVEVNRALAVGRADGPHAGLHIIEPVIASGRLEAYAPLYAVYADLLEGVGNKDGARVAWRTGAEHADNAIQRRAMLDRAGSA
jgi:RNA polymerase sigma-70 factor (ECF subfamily)